MYAKRNYAMKSLFLIPVILLYISIILVTFAFTIYYYFNEPLSLIKALLSSSFYFCLTMVLYNHFLTMTTEPGKVEEEKCSKFSEQELKELQKPENKKYFFKTYCKKCKIVRPERSHHCKTCKRCVLKMNQHCPWMFNCIGINNQKYYYLFLFYSMIGVSIVLSSMIYKVMHYELTPKEECNDGVFLFKSFKKFKFLGIMINNEFFVILMQVYCNVSDAIHMALVIVLAIFLFLAAFCFFEIQTILILKNKTWIESLRLKKSQNSPYCFNEKLKNLKLVLGNSVLQWFFPIAGPYDGYNFPKPNLEKFNEVEKKYFSRKKQN